MTVTELLKRMAGAYPSFEVKAGETWAPVFRARLDKHEGAAIEAAYLAVLSSFRPTARQPFPIPVDFEQHLPSLSLSLPGNGPVLDVKGHRSRLNSLMSIWRAGQGARGSKGIPEVLRALEFIAHPIAEAAAWNENPEPIVLTVKQLKLAQQRAISQQRRAEHGPLGKDPDAWWEQISAIAARWGIEARIEDWTSDTPERKAAA